MSTRVSTMPRASSFMRSSADDAERAIAARRWAYWRSDAQSGESRVLATIWIR